MTHIATIDEVRQGAVISRPDSAELEGLAPAEDDGSYPATGRSDTTGSAPPMPQRSPSPRRGRGRLAWVAGVALVALAAIAGQRAWQSEGSSAAPPPAPPPVTVSQPLQATVGATTGPLGQLAR